MQSPYSPCRSKVCQARRPESFHGRGAGGSGKLACQPALRNRVWALWLPCLLGKKRAYLKKWRVVKKDKTLKSPPSYFELARARDLNTSWITSPLNRNCLINMSMTSNLLQKFAILRLTKTFGRNSLSTTGIVPTLTDGCTNMFVPADATTLSAKQLFCLTGLHPEKHRRAFKVLPRILYSPQKDFRASTMISLLWVLMFFVIKPRLLGLLGSVCQDDRYRDRWPRRRCDDFTCSRPCHGTRTELAACLTEPLMFSVGVAGGIRPHGA